MMQNGDAISDQQAQVVVMNNEGNVQALIKTIRGVQVMLDRDLAKLYGVETGALNRQVKRNEERFPEDFMFRLSAEEWENLKCQFGISSWGGDRQVPFAFTENGIAMLSSVLRSPTAIEVNIRIMRAFNAQYPKLAVRYNESFHDRFLIVDDKELYLIGASLKDLGRKCFGFTKMDKGEIRRIKKEVFTVTKNGGTQ